MKQATIISIDPGVKTLGELHINEHRLAALSRSLSDTSKKSSGRIAFPDMIFGINPRTSADFSSKISLVRVVVGLFMAACTLVPASASFTTSQTIIIAALGISIGFGLMTRITGLIVSAIIGCHALTSFYTMTPDFAAAAFASVAFLFAVLGPGKYSCDFYLRNLLRTALLPNKKAETPETGFDYRAYNNIDSRLQY